MLEWKREKLRETEILSYVIQIFVINIEGLTRDSSFICTGLNMG